MRATDRLRERMYPIKAGRYLIGLSGGADSVALLMTLLPDIRDGRIAAEAVHVNHGLRGTESDDDEKFCRELCEREGVPLTVYRADLQGKTDEDSARKARYGFFREKYKAFKADGLILAHHADDQAETFLMRLTRGAGPEGLECMREDETVEDIRILRPMLRIRREEIRAALTEDGTGWREDSTNTDTAYLRNKVRQELIPALEAISESAVDKICRTAGMIAADNDVLDAAAEKLLRENAKGSILNAAAITAEPEAVRRRVLRKWWNAEGPVLEEHALSAAQTEALTALLDVTKGKINLPGGAYAVRTGKHLILRRSEKEEAPEPAAFSGKETVFGDYRITVGPSEGNPGDGKRTQEVPDGFFEGCEIRTRRPGDRIRPFGSTGSRKLQDYLTDRRIGEPFRDQIPLICRGNEVLLVCGVGAGNIPRWNGEDHPVRITWHGETPWTE
ncbi:tRNA lysidine(34) synthetase TilS [Aristaeella hokkaidonensis]|uniref:tRNA lysidine(34) synthetase TilS n=1 Tax=Aristaeella hokkaidonensis TaxID=3046382 RepID=A0AC61N838_9FIRM|nr:tRNA lysidine(34) synthetase TilS [Aristaeella hokkaidonensis]QUC68131.1 tRNA lysidine(34) synthetase TilS [Aristaeella hokkaidonensis]